MENRRNDEKLNNENATHSRRSLFSLALIGGATALSILKSGKANADALGGDTGVLLEIKRWLETTHLASIAPALDSINNGYSIAKGFVQDWNKFVSAYNQAAQFMHDGISMLTKPQENIFYQQLKQMIDYVDHILSYRGNFLNFRLQYFHPVLFSKVDSMVFNVNSFVKRAKNLAILQYFDLKDEHLITENHRREFEKKYPKSNAHKISVRVSNDVANYGYDALKIEAYKTTVESLKKSINDYPVNPGPPRKGEAPQKSRGQVFQELSSVTSVDIALQQAHLLNEISIKLTNIMVLLTQTGHGPIVSEDEEIISNTKFNNMLSKAKESFKESDYALLKNSKEKKIS